MILSLSMALFAAGALCLLELGAGLYFFFSSSGYFRYFVCCRIGGDICYFRYIQCELDIYDTYIAND